jgi:hypothetical protein
MGCEPFFFIHTTPKDEAASQPLDLQQSHGCLHIRPKERDTMIEKGYLTEGVRVVVKRYEERRPQ